MFRDFVLKFPLYGALLLGLLSSCSNKVEDINDSEEASSFVNTPVKLENSVEHKSLWSDSAWNDIPNYALFKFKTCLRDKAVTEAVIDEPFKITSPTGSRVINTDIDGCLVWSEKIDFNFLEQERLYSYPISIVGVGHYKGKRSFDLALNPWPGATRPVVYLKNEPELANTFNIYGLKESIDELKAQSNNLIISDVGFSARPKKSHKTSEEYLLDLQFRALMSIKGLNGENKTNKEISKGRFKVDLKLFETPAAENSDTVDNYLVSENSIEVQAISGQVQKLVSFHVPNDLTLNRNSFYHLEMVVKPINAPSQLAKSEILNITDFDISTGSIGIVNRADELITATERPEVKLPDPAESVVIGEEVEGDDRKGYFIKKVSNIKRGSIVGDTYRSSSIKTRRAKFTLCLIEDTTNNNQPPLADTRVRVDIDLGDGKTDSPETDRVYKTNEDGCIDTFANITYDRYGIERWIPFKFTVTPLDGHYVDLSKSRTLKVNPWNPEDFGYDTRYETEIPEINAQAPRLFVGSVNYKKEMMDYSNFRINEFLHLSLNRKFQLTFSPQVELFHSYRDETVTEALTYGEYEVSLSLFVPESTDVDYYNPDLSQFRFLTSAKKDLKVQANGKITDLLSLPFLVSETQDLSYKNLALMTIKMKGTKSKIRPVTVAFPFFGGKGGANMPSVPYEQTISDEIKVQIGQTNKYGKYLPTIDVIGDPAVDPMANFAQNFKVSGKQLNPKAVVKDMKLDEFNKSALVAPWERIRLPKGQSLSEKVELTKRELRTLVTEHTLHYPKSILSKFCRHFYKLPKIKRETRMFQRTETYDGGEQWVDCVDNPNEHFKVTPVTHIRKILSQKSDRPNEAFATYVDSDRGQVSRGNAFFAAYGDRSSAVTGEREAEQKHTSVSYGIEGPGPYYFGFSQGYSKEYATFEQQNQADMEAAFDRYYTQRKLTELEFDRLQLKFYAQVRRCVTIVGSKTTDARVHLCEDNDRPKELEEEWYFIGDVRSQSHGMIADGSFPGLTGFTQVIRGRYNYNRIWDRYKNEDIKLVLEEVGDSRGLTYAFKRYLKQTEGGVPYENFVDNSHPGLYIKPRY